MADAHTSRAEDLDPGVARLLKMLAVTRGGQPPEPGIEARRQALAELLRLGGEPARSDELVEEWQIPGAAAQLRIRVHSALDAPPISPALIYFHGGGLVAGSIDTHDGIARQLARACRLIAVDYRLAPEHPFPAALEDACAAVEYLAAHADEFSIDADRLGLCGDSAGASLAAGACRILSRRGVAIRLQLLLCPILDFSAQARDDPALRQGYLVDRQTLDADLAHYLPAGFDSSDPRISPLRDDDLRGLPRTLIHTASCDPVESQGRRFAARLEQGQVEVSLRCHPGMIHLFYGLGAFIPYAKQAFDEIHREVHAALR